MIEKITFNNRIFSRNTSSKWHSDKSFFTRRKYIGSIDGKRKTKKLFLHRVIWEYYKGPIPNDCIIHHIDGDFKNNDISNLECMPEYFKRNPDYHPHDKNILKEKLVNSG